MSSRAKPCCIPNCEDRESPSHHIPRLAAVQSIWLQRIGNPKLFGMVTSLLRGYTLCELHFSPLCLIESGKLRKNDLPTRNLPSTHNEPTDCFIQSPSAALQNVERDFLSAIDTKRYLLTAVVENLRPSKAVEPSQEESPPWKVKIPQKTHQPHLLFYLKLGQHMILVKSLRIRGKKLSPDALIFYDKLRFLRRQQHQTKLRNLSLKKKVNLLTKRPYLMNCLNSLNDATSNFVMSQQRNQKLQPKGRRFTTEDKILALSIFKQCGRCYRYLSQIFSLPSRRTLTNLLSKGYLIDEEEIIHLYDPPHLLKGVRNSLLCKDLHFIEEGKEKVAS
nr:unnamed protein product [Callosobruchus analis]